MFLATFLRRALNPFHNPNRLARKHGIQELPYSFVKGYIAEIIIERLFLESGWYVERTGGQYRGALKPSGGMKLNNGMSANYPDMKIFREGESKSHLVEVKYRYKGKFKVEDDYQYENAFIVLLTKKSILAARAKDVKKGVGGWNWKRIWEIEEFGIKEGVAKAFHAMSHDFYLGTLQVRDGF